MELIRYGQIDKLTMDESLTDPRTEHPNCIIWRGHSWSNADGLLGICPKFHYLSS